MQQELKNCGSGSKVQKISGNKAFWGVQFDKTIKIMYVTIILKILQNLKNSLTEICLKNVIQWSFSISFSAHTIKAEQPRNTNGTVLTARSDINSSLEHLNIDEIFKI